MVTTINRNVASKNNDATETKDVMAGRTAKLVSTACKLSLEANSAKRAAFAAAMAFGLLHGELRYMNDLFKGLSREDQEAMRIFALPELSVQFDPNAKREIQDGKEKWIVRPVNFIDFRSSPKQSEDHITWSDIKPKDGDTAAIQETKARRKATKQAARKALEKHGETVIAFQWVREERIGTIGAEFTQTKFLDGMFSMLKRGAKLKAHGKPVYTREEVIKMGATIGLSVKEIESLKEIWDGANAIPSASSDNKPSAREETNEGERKVA